MVRGRAAGLISGAIVLVGCASPGPPRPPSLQLPQPVRDLSATREGDQVTLRFTLPQRTTDSLPIREGLLKASVCRGAEAQPCVPVPSLKDVGISVSPRTTAADRAITWQDQLPAAESTGEPRLLLYRVRLSNLEDKTAGWSEPALTAAGAAPPAVQGLTAEETRAGILLHWQSAEGPSGGNVLLRRELVSPPMKAKREDLEPVWLDSHATGAASTIDSTAAEDTPYRYIAVRRKTVTLGQQTVKIDSAASAPVVITWHNAFPPPAPSGLSAAPFAEAGAFAVDLVWEPVEEPGLKGYVVTRQAIDAAGTPLGSPERLTPQPVELPAFHDATAKQGVRYRYTVQAVSKKSVEGQTATVDAVP
ncbi:MAG TPA: hypothetical protein VGU25_12235 [Acidobacteriaceae bacterium]|nr:hypothetical protein [Acidobacteriaceae bacterium]